MMGGDADTMETLDERFLRRAIALAGQARDGGADPFGAVLVVDDTIVQEASDQSVALSDPTQHAELCAISAYCRRTRLFALDGYTLYASTEPCAMCAGAIHWARLSRLVFSVSQYMLQQFSGGHPKVPAATIVQATHRRIEVVGPLLSDEGLAVLNGYAFNTKAVRHRRLWGP